MPRLELFSAPGIVTLDESQSTPIGTNMVKSEPCKELEGGRNYLRLGLPLTNLHLPGFLILAQMLSDVI